MGYPIFFYRRLSTNFFLSKIDLKMKKIDFFTSSFGIFFDEIIFLLYLVSCGVQKVTVENKWEQLVHYNLQKTVMRITVVKLVTFIP
jgi:hypothetical protein